jgi:hypothetical protein
LGADADRRAGSQHCRREKSSGVHEIDSMTIAAALSRHCRARISQERAAMPAILLDWGALT